MTDLTPIPFPRSYWVVPGKLLVGPYPGSLDPVEAGRRLAALVACGIRQVISLMEADEVNHQGQPFIPYLEKLQALAAEAGEQVGWMRHAIRDGGPPTRGLMKQILDEIDRSISAGLPVYVHCWGGKGRAGTVVGCYLVRHGLASGETALARILQWRRGIQPFQESPETEEQRDFVRSWKAGE